MRTNHFKTTSSLFLGVMIAIFLTTASCETGSKSTTGEEVKPPSTTIHEATFFGDLHVVKRHVAAKTDLNAKDAYGSAPLHIAATFGRTQVAKVLIEAGADLMTTSADGSTPLHTAAFFGRTEIVKALLAKGSDITARNSFGSTALESVSTPFDQVKPIYDQLSKNLGPMGLKLDYLELQEARSVIAEMISQTVSK